MQQPLLGPYAREKPWAGALILGSASLWSLAPAIIHLSVGDANPFYYNVIYQIASALLLGLFLLIAKRRAFDQSWSLRKIQSAHVFSRYIGADQDCRRIIRLQRASLHAPRSWLRLPVVWTALGQADIVLYAWSTRYIETAVTATVYELWPVLFVFMLVKSDRTHKLFLESRSRSRSSGSSGQLEQVLLSTIGGVGLAFMLVSQSGNPESLEEFFTLEGLIGVALALLAATAAATFVLGSLVFGRTAHSVLLEGSAQPTTSIANSQRDVAWPVLWLTIFGVAAAKLAVVIPTVFAGLTASVHYGGLNPDAVAGALALGIVGAGTIILVRLGNLLSHRPGANALLLAAPAMALMWLLLLGVSLPRFDLFLVGAALILAINILLQIKPDSERDYAQFGKKPMKGTRLGFTAYIMSLWCFGTIIYLRDEAFPALWLLWPGDEYWGLLALSATVFALILGFRMARLSNHISTEDEIMFRLFRLSEYLVRQSVLDKSVINALDELDTARPRSLLSAYNRVRAQIERAFDRNLDVDRGIGSLDTDVETRLLEVERDLDLVAHSKQQGRDIVELMSLMAFALVTIGLGLFSRPFQLGVVEQRWSGFVAEMFVLLLVSTVGFLAFNLFDVRRERETPLLVEFESSEMRQSRHRLFFRYRRELAVAHTVAIVVSAAMTMTFGVLLYAKWH